MSENYGRYKPPRGPETSEDMELVANYVAKRIKARIDKKPDLKITTEIVIEAFRDMNDDYDDWWVRDLNTREKEQKFTRELLRLLKSRGIDEVEDNTFI